MVNKQKITPEMQEMVAQLAREQVEKILINQTISSDVSDAKDQGEKRRRKPRVPAKFIYTTPEMQSLLRKGIEKKELTQDQLADIVGCSRGVISAALNASRRVNSKSIRKIFDCLGMKSKYESLDAKNPDQDFSKEIEREVPQLEDGQLIHRIYSLFNRHTNKTSKKYIPLKVLTDNIEYNFPDRPSTIGWLKDKAKENYWHITSFNHDITGRKMDILTLQGKQNDAAKKVLISEIQNKTTHILRKAGKGEGVAWREIQQKLRSVGANAAAAKIGIAEMMKEGIVERFEEKGRVFIRLTSNEKESPAQIENLTLFDMRGMPTAEEIQFSEKLNKKNESSESLNKSNYYLKTNISNSHIQFSEAMRLELRKAIVSSHFSNDEKISAELINDKIKLSANKTNSLVNLESIGIHRHYTLNLSTVGRFIKGEISLHLDEIRLLCIVLNKEELLGSLMNDSVLEICHL
jgi:transcriptional regulator with XRE-family HTH domain